MNRQQHCACGHSRDAHEHYRSGTDCALCQCPRLRVHGGLVVQLKALIGGPSTRRSEAVHSLMNALRNR